MVFVNGLKDSLDLRHIHDSIHTLVMSRRRAIGFWDGLFESCWAGYVLACHSPENRSDEIINSLKGEVLGEGRLDKVNDDYSLASCFIISAFLNKVGSRSEAEYFISLAEEYVQQDIIEFSYNERFQFFSTPEYVYAGALAFQDFASIMSKKTISSLEQATRAVFERNWGDSSYRFALMGSALLKIVGFQSEIAAGLASFADSFIPQIEEDNIPLLWFLDMNWHAMRHVLINDSSSLIESLDTKLPEIRTKVFRVFPNFVLEPAEYQGNAGSLSETEKLDYVANTRVVNTIELLMLDEVAEKHTISSIVVTRQELENRYIVPMAIKRHQERVNIGLDKIGLSNELEAVYSNLEGNNSSHWSSAVFACRRILYELADRLLVVPDEVYPYLTDKSGKNPISIKKDKERNRLLAYMHQMGVKNSNPLIAAQLEMLGGMMHELVSQTSGEGKRSNLDYDTALSIVLNTYFFLGELIRLTDFQIITEIEDPKAMS